MKRYTHLMSVAVHKTRWAWILATFFGAGYGTPGPGTYGSCATVLLWLAAGRLLHLHINHFNLCTLIAAILVTLIGIPVSTIVAREAGHKDPSFIVIDEVAGQLFALALAQPTIPQALFALVLFRLFDIFKPWPIRKLEALPNGAGIMLDDVAAGLFALVSFVLLTLLIELVRFWGVR